MSVFSTPTKEQYKLLKNVPPGSSVHMLNLIRFRVETSYHDGRKVSGRDAYAAYSRESGPYFKEVGGKIIWRGSGAFTAIGPQEEKWDEVFVAEYPSIDHFFGMLRNSGYQQKAVVHRQAAVEDSRLIRVSPLEPGEFFKAS